MQSSQSGSNSSQMMSTSTPLRIPPTNSKELSHSPGGSIANMSSLGSVSMLGNAGTTPSPTALVAALGSSNSVSSTPPNSAGLAKYPDDRVKRKAPIPVCLPKLPSSDSLSNSPGPSTPGITNWGETSAKFDANNSDKSPGDTSKLNRKESYKAQRKNYRREKKRVASELLNSLQDPAVIVLADWLKVRGTLKSWTKLWCVLKPGLLLLYKSPKTKSSHWVGTILLTSCQVIERPSKKDGFCFKLFHPMEQSIWAPRGPDKETIGAVVQPLPTAYLIFRAPSQAAGKCWMDALELSLRCSALLLRSNSNQGTATGSNDSASGQISHETQWSEADYEKHFNDHEEIMFPVPVRHQYQFSKTNTLAPPEAFPKNISRTPSPPATPLLQQFYTAVSHWERIVSSTSELKKIGHFRMGHKSRNNGDVSDFSSVGDFSSVADFSPIKKKRKFRKSLSLNFLQKSFATSDDDDDAGDEEEMADESSRRKSTPGMLFEKYLCDLDADSQNEGATAMMSGPESDSDSEAEPGDGADVDQEDPETLNENEDPPETPYVQLEEDEFGDAGEQVEDLTDEHKSLLWFLVKQVRPGMDLSKVVLPTFILEPRSFLDKLSDSYYHADFLSKAAQEDDPFTRMKTVVQWYMSGFYKKPKGLKKPYNPILGETYRCYWEHPNGSRTFFIAEQVSHHPPISTFYVTNRQDGFCISCNILAKSKFYGNSTSAVLEGQASLTLLPRGETYTMNSPYAHCKGILLGTLSMELGGKVNIDCENTGYKAEIEFKLKPFLGGSEYTNLVSGKIKLGKETMASISGHWDTDIKIKDSKSGEETILFSASKEAKQQRLKRYVVPIESQGPTESERMWQLVTAAIRRDDQVGATEEKTVLEESQRNSAKERKATLTEWIPAYFQQDMLTGQWIYKYADLRPWDLRNDVKQYEFNYRVLTKTRHQAPMVRTASIVSSEPLHSIRVDSRQSLAVLKAKRKGVLKTKSITQLAHENNNSDSSQSNEEVVKNKLSSKSITKLLDSIDKINNTLDQHTRQLQSIQTKLDRMQNSPGGLSKLFNASLNQSTVVKSLIYIAVGIFLCLVGKWLFKK